MFTIRPKNAEECDVFLKRAVTNVQPHLEPDTPHYSVWKSIAALNDFDWGSKLIRPMYEKNMIVQMGFNTLTPVFIGMLTDKKKTDNTMNNLSESKRATLEKEYRDVMDKMKEAVDINKTRAKTEDMDEEFVKMRDVCSLLCEDPTVVEGLRVVFYIDGISRTVFNVMLPRLTEGLKNDNKIEPSSDIASFF